MKDRRTAADLGGLPGFGPVIPESDEPLFHAPWERTALGLTLAMGASGRWTIDHARAARESLPLTTYRTSSYYQIWLDALEALMLRYRLVAPDELASGRMRMPPVALPARLAATDVAAALARGSPTLRAVSTRPRFALGDPVRTRENMPSGHTRLPVYARGKPARVQALHGAHVFADRHADSDGPPFDEDPQWLYTIEFEGRDLWGHGCEPGLRVSIDAWEPYLEPA